MAKNSDLKIGTTLAVSGSTLISLSQTQELPWGMFIGGIFLVVGLILVWK